MAVRGVYRGLRDRRVAALVHVGLVGKDPCDDGRYPPLEPLQIANMLKSQSSASLQLAAVRRGPAWLRLSTQRAGTAASTVGAELGRRTRFRLSGATRCVEAKPRASCQVLADNTSAAGRKYWQCAVAGLQQTLAGALGWPKDALSRDPRDAKSLLSWCWKK